MVRSLDSRRAAPALSCLLVAAMLFACAGPAPERSPNAKPALETDRGTTLPGPELEPWQRGFAALRLERDLAGVVVAVSKYGEVVWAEGFGYADVEQSVPMAPATMVRIGSVSKAITSLGLGLLVEQGGIDLDAPIQAYVPGFPKKAYPTTTRQLAGHTAGIRHYRDSEFLLAKRFDSVGDALEVFADDPLLFEPDTDYSYSSYGWNLVSAVIEGAAGAPFVDFMRASVLDPLGLVSVRTDDNVAIVARRGRFYYRTESGELANAPYVDNSVKWAGGGYLASMLGLLDFGEAVLGDRLIGAETRELLWRPRTTNDGRSTGYGLGWFDYGVPPRGGASDDSLPEGVDLARLRSHRIVGHGGGSVGGITAFLILPDDGIVAAAHSNTSGAGPLGRDLHLILAAAAVDVAEGS